MWNEVCFLETLCCRSPLLFSLTQNLFNEISSSEVCSFQTTWQKCKISAFEECVMHFITCCMSSFYLITFLALGKVLVSVRFEKNRTTAFWQAFFHHHTGYRGLPRVTAGYCGLPRVTAGYRGLPRVTAGYHGLPRVTTASRFDWPLH